MAADRPRTLTRQQRRAATPRAAAASTAGADEHLWSAARRLIAGGQVAVIGCIVASCLLFGVVYVDAFIDDAGYHIPNAVRIAQHLNPYFVDSPVDSHWFPAGAETLVALPVWLTGSLNVTNLSGGLCVLALVVLMYHFAGLWCADHLGRLTSALCVATIPLMIGQSMAFYIDIHLALVVCLSLYLQCLSLVRRRAAYAYGALAVALLAPAIKYSGLFLFGILAPACAYCLWAAPRPRRPTVRTVTLLLCVALFTSGWYVRNWVSRGNPVYPFAVGTWIRPLLAVVHVPFESDPEHGISSPTTAFPHPFVPQSWLTHEFTPHMTADAFGASATVAGLCALLSLPWLARLEVARRRAWIFLWIVVVLMLLLFPFGLRIPRYLLCVPVLAALGPAVLYGLATRTGARRAVTLLAAAAGVLGALYVYANLLAPGAVANNVRLAWSHLAPYTPVGGKSYPYVRRGHLRIGYTSGFSNFIAALYDPGLTNTLIPLHYKNYPYNYGHEMGSPEEFIEHVRSLQLDYIHVFDKRYPGVDLLRKAFPDKIRGIDD